ncbi:MAG: hypothetical protein Q4E67_01075 [Planctomycetia bacterium]|nr:hypothetical protein [Planctomycetia bacterium]
MKYRDFGKTGEKVSTLGFGRMRLATNLENVTTDERAPTRDLIQRMEDAKQTGKNRHWRKLS